MNDQINQNNNNNNLWLKEEFTTDILNQITMKEQHIETSGMQLKIT